MFKTSQIKCVCSGKIKFGILAGCSRIVGRLHVKIVTERRIILGFHLNRDDAGQEQYGDKAFKHVDITAALRNYCINDKAASLRETTLCVFE